VSKSAGKPSNMHDERVRHVAALIKRQQFIDRYIEERGPQRWASDELLAIDWVIGEVDPKGELTDLAQAWLRR
jgi:hypothetical protein